MDDLRLLEGDDLPSVAGAPWCVLVVDDDEEVHVVTRLALEGFRFAGRPVELLSAHSNAAAQKVLSRRPDIALILLDVVMESDRAGLDLVRFVRGRLQNRMVRIVLRTGQPGQAPPREVITENDIDDYRTKTELTFDRLFVVVTAALRTYQLLSTMAEHQRRISHLATHDDLTGLPNRTLLHDRIHQAMAYARRSGRLLALLFIDLDGFKFINDSFGHTQGDALLKAIATRLEREIRAGDTVARLGGDEFVVMLGDVADADDVMRMADKLLRVLSEPTLADGRSLLVTASIGISIYPDDGQNVEVLLQHADSALYAAKHGGRNRVCRYTPELSANADERVLLENALRCAEGLNQFELHYQPRYEVGSGRLSGVEALIRWQHPQLGWVSPNRFIHLAEEVGLINGIGEWVLRAACMQLVRWQRAGLPSFRVAVNVSARQFHEQDIAELVRRVLDETGLDAAFLELEMTENVLINNPDAVLEQLRSLKQLGVQLAIDDFGTGYSSLSYLSRYPIDIIKIDQSFTSQLATSDEAASITRAIIALARALHMKTICEGVETAQQYGFMVDNGCDAVQGHYFSPAVIADELAAIAQRHEAETGPRPVVT